MAVVLAAILWSASGQRVVSEWSVSGQRGDCNVLQRQALLCVTNGQFIGLTLVTGQLYTLYSV